MTPKPKRLVLSMITVESLSALFEAVDQARPLSRIGSSASYGELFTGAAAAKADDPAGSVSLPWPRTTGQGFWSRYFETPFEALSPSQAWRSVVPLRVRQPTVTTNDATVATELFLYPGASAAITTLRLALDGPTAPTDAVLAALERDADIAGRDAAVRVRDLAGVLLDRARSDALGPGGNADLRAGPFVVASIIDADGADADVAVKSGGSVHRLLDGLASLNRNWKTAALPKLADRTVAARQAPVGHLIYARRDGRAVWLPRYFGTDPRRTIGCYHRNLVLASMTVAALSAIVRQTGRQLDDGQTLDDLPLAQESISRRAVVQLTQLWRGRDTYATRSARIQIADGAQSEIVALRKALGMNPADLPA